MIEKSGKTSDNLLGKRNLSFSGFSEKPGSPQGLLLVGDYEHDTGNAFFSGWTLNSHTLTLSGGNCHGIRVRQTVGDDYVKVDPANPPIGVIMAGAIIDVNRVYQRKDRHLIIAQIIDFYTDRMGKKGKLYWKIFCQTSQATEATTQEDFEEELNTAIDAQDLDICATKLLAILLARIKIIVTPTEFNKLPGVTDLAKIVLWIKSKSVEQLAGNKTEVVEEYSNG